MSRSSMNAAEINAEAESSDKRLEDLNILNFPSDVDWSSTLVLRCDPAGAPYNLSEVYTALYSVVLRRDVFTLGPTTLNYAFTISFKTTGATEKFVVFLKSRRNGELTVKKLPCLVSRVPTKCVTICVKWIPIEIDSIHIIDILKEYGTIVKTEWVKSNMRGWFHVYTNERKFTMLLHKNVDVRDLPFGINVKGLFGAVYIVERNPKCLECYYSGHAGETCKYEGCPFHRRS